MVCCAAAVETSNRKEMRQKYRDTDDKQLGVVNTLANDRMLAKVQRGWQGYEQALTMREERKELYGVAWRAPSVVRYIALVHL